MSQRNRAELEGVETSPDGRYIRFDEKLGSGAYKSVWLAYDTDHGIEVAWNTVDLKRLPDREKTRLKSETDILKDLNHQCIINFYNSWENPELEQVVFTTEIVTSGTLKQYVSRFKPIKLRVIKRWCRQILSGLCYLHSKNPPIIHRDLKCDNIFINGSTGDIRIGDLGLSTMRSATHVASVLGTPEFMAPELYDEWYTEKVDVYAFGMCVLEMITNEYPYAECTNTAQIFKKVSAGVRPEALNRIANVQTRSFIELCLAKSPVRMAAADLLRHPFLDLKFLDWRDRAALPYDSIVVAANPVPTTAAVASMASEIQSPSVVTPAAEAHGTDTAVPLDAISATSGFTDETGEAQVSSLEVILESTSDNIARVVLRLDLGNRRKEIKFPFDLASDTAEDVAAEMVKELRLQGTARVKLADGIFNAIRDERQKWRNATSGAPRTGDLPVPASRTAVESPLIDIDFVTSPQAIVPGVVRQNSVGMISGSSQAQALVPSKGASSRPQSPPSTNQPPATLGKIAAQQQPSINMATMNLQASSVQQGNFQQRAAQAQQQQQGPLASSPSPTNFSQASNRTAGSQQNPNTPALFSPGSSPALIDLASGKPQPQLSPTSAPFVSSVSSQKAQVTSQSFPATVSSPKSHPPLQRQTSHESAFSENTGNADELVDPFTGRPITPPLQSIYDQQAFPSGPPHSNLSSQTHVPDVMSLNKSPPSSLVRLVSSNPHNLASVATPSQPVFSASSAPKTNAPAVVQTIRRRSDGAIIGIGGSSLGDQIDFNNLQCSDVPLNAMLESGPPAQASANPPVDSSVNSIDSPGNPAQNPQQNRLHAHNFNKSSPDSSAIDISSFLSGFDIALLSQSQLQMLRCSRAQLDESIRVLKAQYASMYREAVNKYKADVFDNLTSWGLNVPNLVIKTSQRQTMGQRSNRMSGQLSRRTRDVINAAQGSSNDLQSLDNSIASKGMSANAKPAQMVSTATNAIFPPDNADHIYNRLIQPFAPHQSANDGAPLLETIYGSSGPPMVSMQQHAPVNNVQGSAWNLTSPYWNDLDQSADPSNWSIPPQGVNDESVVQPIQQANAQAMRPNIQKES